MTSNGEVTRGSFGLAHLEVLRLYAWWALPALGLAALAALLASRAHRAAAPLLPLAFAIAAQPLFSLGAPEATVAGGAAVFAGGGLSVAAFGTSGRRSALALSLGVTMAATFVVATLAVPAAFDPIDGMRVPVALGFSLLGLAAVTDRRRLAEFLTDRQGAGFIDLAYLAGAIGLLGALALIASVPIPLLIVASAIGLAVYPSWRRRTLALLERLLTAPARRDASIRAIEGERGRLAREIHDAPLQELTAVIRRLESLPDMEVETTTLRKVAAHLRDVATTLHPPVLQDIGLPAAIEDHAEQLATKHPDWSIRAAVDDLTGGERPPAEIEIAAFRVVQEASANALAHSCGAVLIIGGAVASDSVELRVTDDGTGIDPDLARTARRSGHFGVDSMHERAQVVGADCTVAGGATGVTVTFRWEPSE